MSMTYRTCTTTRSCRRNSARLPFVTGLLLGCSLAFAQPPPPPGGYAPGIELPEGEARELVLATCTRCHDLRGIPAYKGYWGRAEWRTMVETMRRHGAALGPEQAEAIAAYLDRHFGRKQN